MKLLFKQRMFSWFDSYDIYNEAGETVSEVRGELSWGHCMRIYDARGNEVGMVNQKIFTFLPTFEIYLGGRPVGSISKEFSLFTPKYDIDFNGWHIEGNFFEWDYEIYDCDGQIIATGSNELFNWTDTYSINVHNSRDALCALMLVLAIDAEKCSRDN